MFADTITVTINSVAKILTRINGDGPTSEYYLKDGTTGEFRMKIRHSNYTAKDRGGRKVERHNVELVHVVFPVAPDTVATQRKAYIVLENDQFDGATNPLNFDLGFAGFFTSPNLTKLINNES